MHSFKNRIVISTKYAKSLAQGVRVFLKLLTYYGVYIGLFETIRLNIDTYVIFLKGRLIFFFPLFLSSLLRD